ncbi:phage tail tape measure protein [Virgibacillus proomii]|uniref:phage tail tape measure protein n=1 Tax=Virgibacillus proomii TaxID=84407 RepID=UPI0009860266|nr:phage tail tape measure protein [Virgibacillus proomii]
MTESYSVEAFLKANTTGFNKGFNDAISGLKNFKKNISSIDTTPIRTAGTALQNAGNKMKGVGNSMKSAGRSASMYLTAPLLAAGGAAIATGVSFDDSMARVQAISGATGDQLEQLRDKAKEMGATTKFSASQSAEALNYMALAGWSTEDMLNGIEGVMSLAAASGEDLASVSDIVTDSLTAFGLEAKDSSRFADVLAATSSNANTNVAGLGMAMQYAAPVAGALGYSVEDTATAIGLMSNAGIKGEKAGTALRSMFTNLASPTKAMKTAMDELGISIKNSDGSMKTLDEIMGDLRTSFSGLTDDQKASYAATIFGKEAMSGALAVINASEKDYNKLSDAINNSSGSAEKMAGIMEGTLGGKWREIKSGIEGFAISIYEVMRPALMQGAEMLQNFITWLNNLSPQVKMAAVVIAGLVAIIGPLAIVLGTVITFAGMFVGSLGTLIARFAPLIAQTTVLRNVLLGVMRVFAFISNPITALVAIITTILIPVFIKLYQENQKFREIVMLVWNQIKTVITTVVQTVVAFVMQIWSTLTTFWNEHGQMILQAAMNVWNVIKTVITTVMTVIWTIMQTLWPVIKSLIVSTWNAIKGVIQGAIDVILGVIQFFSALFTGNWSEMWEAVKRIVAGAVKLVWNLVQLWFVGKILKLGKTLFKSLTGIVKNLWSKVSGFFKGGVTKAKDVVSTGFNFIKSKISSVMNAIKSIISSIWNSIKGVIARVVNSIKSKVSNVFNSLKGVTSKAFNAVKNAVKSGMDKALNVVTNIKDKFLDAGKNIVKSIAKGITDSIGKVKDAIGKVTSKIRDFLPFSPAKEGALRDIMKIQIPQSIAKSIDRGRGVAVRSMAGLTEAMNKEIQPSNIASQVDRVNRRSHNSLRYDYTNELTVSKQPAYINVAIGGQEFNTFVEDITQVQDRKTRVRRSFQ